MATVISLKKDSERTVSRYELKGDDSPTLAFLVTHMTDDSGGVYTNLRSDHDLQLNVANNHQILSESVGLLMEYAVRSGNELLFQTQFYFLRNFLITDERFIRWVYDPDGILDNVHTNATIDDLKIIHALLKAAELWGTSEYERTADQLAEALKQYVLLEHYELPDFYDWLHRSPADTITSSYLDLPALSMLAERDSAWKEVNRRAEQLLYEAALPNGLFWKTYRIDKNEWLEQDHFNMIDVLYAALHLEKAGHNAEATRSFLERVWERDGKLYAAYDQNEQVVDDIVSPAVYALAYRLLHRGDTRLLAGQVYDELAQLAIRDDQSPYYGGFVEITTLEAYSFDHLQVLLSELEWKK